MVGARAPATRPRSGRFARRSPPGKSPQRPAVERIPAHDGFGRRPIENKQTLDVVIGSKTRLFDELHLRICLGHRLRRGIAWAYTASCGGVGRAFRLAASQ